MKRVAIVLLLTTVFVSLITATMIVKKQTQFAKNTVISEVDNFNIEETPSEKVVLYQEYHLPIDDGTKGSTLSQTFDINPIKITEHVYEDDKTYAYYFQIDGLANENIEKEINAELKSQIIEFGRFAYDETIKADSDDTYTSFGKYDRGKHYGYDDKPNSWNSCVKETILFNGNNIISIAMTDYENTYLTKYSKNAARFLNYNLINGEKLKIEELFTKELSVADVFTKSLYHQLGEGEIKWNERRYYNEITGEEEWWR